MRSNKHYFIIKHQKIFVQATKRPRRACVANTNAGAYCDFLFSDNEGSGPEEDSSGSSDGEKYNPATEEV